MRLTRLLLLTASGLSCINACQGDGDAGSLADVEAPNGPGMSNPDPGPGSGAPPAELELEENFRSPVVSGRYLWSANPETNRVARIDARSFEIEVLDGGHGPTFVAALPQDEGPSGAVVLNILGEDASVFRSSAGMGGASSTIVSEERLPVQRGASAWAVGPSGRFSVAWSRFEQDLRGPLDGYQDLTVLSLAAEPAFATRISVGFRPTQVVINDAETRAFVVSDPGLSVIDLSTTVPEVLSELVFPDSGEGGARDVSFTPDGEFAFVRLDRRDEILIVRIADNARVTVPLPAEVTDLDLSTDGSIAIAVMRGERLTDGAPPNAMGGAGGQGGEPGVTPNTSSQIAVMPVPGIFDDPDTFDLLVTPELVGSVVIAENASRALLFTSAVDNSRIVILDLESQGLRISDLQAPIQAAFLSEDGRFGAAIMTPPAGSTSSGAFALFVANEDLPPRITGTATVPRFISLTGDRALVTTWGSQTSPAAAFLGKFPSLSVDRVELPSEPLASGMVVEAGQGFVAQTHPEGRVTFIDWETSLPTTVTGFELSSKVVEQ